MATQYSYIECDRMSIFNILTNELEMRKVCTCCVLRELSDLHRKECMGVALEFLTMDREEGNALFNRIIMGDEVWVHYGCPNQKQPPCNGSTKMRKHWKSWRWWLPQGKVMATVFWNWKGVLLVEYLPPKRNITQETYFETILHLRNAIKQKHLRKLSQGIFLLQDNAHPHVTALIQGLLADLGWFVFHHPTYSPDLAPFDYYLFPALKRALRRWHFQTTAELNEGIGDFLYKQEANWFATGIEKLLYRCKCLDAQIYIVKARCVTTKKQGKTVAYLLLRL